MFKLQAQSQKQIYVFTHNLRNNMFMDWDKQYFYLIPVTSCSLHITTNSFHFVFPLRNAGIQFIFSILINRRAQYPNKLHIEMACFSFNNNKKKKKKRKPKRKIATTNLSMIRMHKILQIYKQPFAIPSKHAHIHFVDIFSLQQRYHYWINFVYYFYWHIIYHFFITSHLFLFFTN